nr:hypothetical protein [Tanacetum cinerariifolium]
MDINIDALYNILKQNQGDVNDAMGPKKKTVVVTSDQLALIAEKTNVSRSKEKVVVSSDSEGTQIEKVLSDLEASSSYTDEKISEVSYYLSESKSESEYETSKYYDNSTNYGLFVNNDGDQEIFNDAIESASENFIENHIDSQKDYDKSDEKYAKLEAERYEYMIRYSAYFDNDKEHRKQIADQQVLYDKISV